MILYSFRALSNKIKRTNQTHIQVLFKFNILVVIISGNIPDKRPEPKENSEKGDKNSIRIDMNTTTIWREE